MLYLEKQVTELHGVLLPPISYPNSEIHCLLGTIVQISVNLYVRNPSSAFSNLQTPVTTRFQAS